MESTAPQRPKSPTLTFLVGIGGLALFALITFLLPRFFKQPDTYDQSRAVTRAETLAELRKSVEELKGTYTYTDKAAGKVRLPVERAMTLVLTDLQSGQPRPSGVKVPPPIVLPDPAAAPAPVDAPPAAAATPAVAPTSVPPPADQPGSLFPAPSAAPSPAGASAKPPVAPATPPITPVAPVAPVAPTQALPTPTPGGAQP